MINLNRLLGANASLGIAFMALFSSTQAQGAITLTFSGNYDTQNTTYYANDSDLGSPSNLTVFGLAQPSAAASYDFTFNESATPTILASGSAVTFVDGNAVTGTFARTWYGYSSSDLTALSVNINGAEWTMSDLSGFYMGAFAGSDNLGSDKHIWFDQNIAVATPTRAIFDFDNSNGNYFGTTKGFLIAGGLNPGSGLFSSVFDSGNNATITQYRSNSIPDESVSAEATSFTITSSVPEPSRTLYLMLGLVILNQRRRRL